MLISKAFAKINLGLRILRKRGDGYHDIETIFHRVNIFDELTFSSSPSITLTCNRPELSQGEDNLCTKAANFLHEAYSVKDGVHIQLTKHIPVGAGLGGGSADAATTLLSLNHFWSLNLDKKSLEAFALQLGSDVPFFLHEGSAYATGRGERLEYFQLDLPYWIVLVFPNVNISTAWAYQKSEIIDQKPKIKIKDTLLENIHRPQRLMTLIQNDFEPLVLRSYPVIAQVKKRLYDLGAEFAQMSGSGSSMYGLFSNEQHVLDAADELKKTHLVFVTPPHFTAELQK